MSIVHGLEPLSPKEIKNYIEHRLRIAGYEGEPLFAPEIYEDIARFTQGIPRNINNFCSNALSLTCALQKKIVDSEAVKEVIADLDISKLTSDAGSDLASGFDMPYLPSRQPPVAPGHGQNNNHEILSPAEAAAYMQQVALKLKNWAGLSDKAISGPRIGLPVLGADGYRTVIDGGRLNLLRQCRICERAGSCGTKPNYCSRVGLFDYAFANREGEAEGNCDSGGGVCTTFSVARGDTFFPVPWSPESVPLRTCHPGCKRTARLQPAWKRPACQISGTDNS